MKKQKPIDQWRALPAKVRQEVTRTLDELASGANKRWLGKAPAYRIAARILRDAGKGGKRRG